MGAEILSLAVTTLPALVRIVPAALRLLAGAALVLAGLFGSLLLLTGARATGRTGFLAISLLLLGASGAGVGLVSTVLVRPSRPRQPERSPPQRERSSPPAQGPNSQYRAYGIAVAVLGAIVGVGVVLSGANPFFVEHRIQPMRLAWYLLLVLLALPVTIALHEFGHATAARLVALRFHRLRVGPIDLRRDKGRWRLAWARVAPGDPDGTFESWGDDASPSWGGLVALAAGGPLASAASACAFAAAASWLGDGHTLARVVAADALWAAAGVGGFDAIVNFVPWHRTPTGETLDDGSRLALTFRFRRRAGHLVLRFLRARRLGRVPRTLASTRRSA